MYYQYCKSFTCGENFDKKILFFWFSVLDKIRLSSRSATTLISQQPWKHKAAATLISNHKLQNNCSLKKYISEHKYKNYMNLCEFIDNKWCFNNKKCSLISNHKLLNNCSLKKYISEHKYKNYVNSCKFMNNKWCFNNKNFFYCH